MGGTPDSHLAALERSLSGRNTYTPDEYLILSLVQRLRVALSETTASTALPDAALALAQRTLQYLGWLDGTFMEIMDGDVAMKDAALAVFEALGEAAPARVRLKRASPAKRGAPDGEASSPLAPAPAEPVHSKLTGGG